MTYWIKQDKYIRKSNREVYDILNMSLNTAYKDVQKTDWEDTIVQLGDCGTKTTGTDSGTLPQY